MAKTTVADRTFKIVDLIRKRDSFQYVEVPKYPVEVTISVTTSATLVTPKPAPSAVFDRLEKVARAKLDEYEEIITTELVKIEAKIKGLLEQPGADAAKEAQELIQGATAMVKKALDSAEPAAQKVIEERLKKEAQADDLLKEARVKTAIKVTFGVISLAASATKLAVTAGADVTSYFSIAKTLASLGLELKQQLKGEEKLRQDLKDGVEAFLNTRNSVIADAMKKQNLTDTANLPKNPKDAIKFIIKGVVAAGGDVLKNRSAVDVAKEVGDFVLKGIKGKLNDAESARAAYRNHLAVMREKIDGISAKADELMKAMKEAKTLKDGVKIGAECMSLKANVRKMATDLEENEKYLLEVQEVLKGGGLDCDDETIVQKLKKLSVSTIASEGASLGLNIKSVYDLISTAASAAH
jgi:hypothetical protein